MLIIDGHCDTMSLLYSEREKTNFDLFNNPFHFSFNKTSKNSQHIQFAAIFTNPCFSSEYILQNLLCILEMINRYIDINSDVITLCCNKSKLDECIVKEKTGIVISVEGGEALLGDPLILRLYKRLGVSSVCLCWNKRNQLADGVSEGSSGHGISSKGRLIIEEMNRSGVIVDVSHLCKKSFHDVLLHSQKPVIASHSNAYSLCQNPRNLDDEQLKEIKRNNGVAGVNFYPPHLSNTGEADLYDIIRHIDYICSLIGAQHAGIGSDFDGVDKLPSGINGVEDVYKIYNELLKLNYKEADVKCIAGLNFKRVLEDNYE